MIDPRIRPGRPPAPPPAPRWSRETRARMGFLAGLLLASLGLGWQVGAGWGALLCGLGVCVMFVFLWRVDDDDDQDQPLDDDQEWPGP